MPNVGLVRAWCLIVVGLAGIVLGLLDTNATLTMLGFAMLGTEPVVRAANGANGV